MSDSWQDMEDSKQNESEEKIEIGDFRDIETDFAQGIREMESQGLMDIGALAAWSVSSSKPGNGIKELREDSPLTYWQSDGIQPHHIDIHFSKRVTISKISFFTDHPLDESYTPSKIVVLAGNGFHDLLEVDTLELYQPVGWSHVHIEKLKGLEEGLQVFLVRILIVANHMQGKDTHLRSLRIYSAMAQHSFDTGALGSFTSRKMIASSTIR